jgi:tetratricopeptide (TPR) repeat protein
LAIVDSLNANGPVSTKPGQLQSAHALAHLVRDFDGSIALLDRALVLDPNLAAGWYLGGLLRIWRGELDDAIARIARGMRLSPLGPDMERMEVGTAMAYLLSGRTEDALSWAEKASRHMSDQALPISIFAAIYARAGRGNEARLAVQQLRRLDPALRLSKLGEWLPFQRSQDLDTFADALREAGLPK